MNTQTSALNAATGIINLMAQFVSLSNSVDAFLKDYNQNTWDTFWQQMATVSVNADGSVAASNDTTPNLAHPINLPSGAPILVSRSNLINGVTLIEKFQTFMSQAGGTLTLSTQANTTTAYMITG